MANRSSKVPGPAGVFRTAPGAARHAAPRIGEERSDTPNRGEAALGQRTGVWLEDRRRPPIIPGGPEAGTGRETPDGPLTGEPASKSPACGPGIRQDGQRGGRRADEWHYNRRRMAIQCEPLKVAFIGSHGVGKTTLCYGLAARLKARDVPVDVVHEVARRCPLPINEETSVAAQSWILHTQIAEELVASSRYPVVITDRSVLDNYVYLLIAAGRQDGLEPLLGFWMTTYDLLVHVPILDEPSPDGVRATNPSFQAEVDRRLLTELAGRGLAAVSLEPSARREWLGTVEALAWERLQPAQLPLLP